MARDKRQRSRASFQQQLRRAVARIPQIGSLLLLAIFIVSYWLRPDWMMYATIIPVFCWLTSGLIVSLLIRKSRLRVTLVVAWLLVSLVLGDSPQNLLRMAIPVDRDWAAARHGKVESISNRKSIRIVSLNCMGKVDPIAEASLLFPDVLLVQESVRIEDFEAIRATHFPDYQMAWSQDTSILARGSVAVLPAAEFIAPRYQVCNIGFEDGFSLHAVSVHLIHSPRRIDIWNPETWRLFADLRKTRRRQMLEIRAEIGSSIGTGPAIVGGDFNAPAGDPTYDSLRPRFSDAWTHAGRGWGKTSLNQYPVHRIDQIWISKQLRPINVYAKETLRSDHRMVICDAWLMK